MNCADLDDDNDGIPDALDPCPVGVDPFERDCQVVRDCACGSADWWRACLGTGCVALEARIAPLIYPQPDETVIVDNVRVSGRSLYLIPAAGNTVPQLARALVGGPHGVRQPQGPAPMSVVSSSGPNRPRPHRRAWLPWWASTMSPR
ncbi:MAG: hypothetical protein M5U12_30500 [Verrucomicrobia bacterium]|nr:hypothetical protein [Verrucomicrobiota bacterium]